MIATQEKIDLKALKASVDLLSLVRERGLEPVRHGHNKWKLNCPFHDDTEASLILSPHKNLWHCFGCDKGGSPIDFVKELDGVSVRDAILQLAEKTNGLPAVSATQSLQAGRVRPAADLPERVASNGKLSAVRPSPEEPVRTPEQQKLLNKVSEFYHKSLQQHLEGRAYLKERGLTDAALLESFRLGYANGTILDAIPPEGEILESLQALGLLDKQHREHFRDCVVFPIFDQHGNVTEMYGRKVLEGSKVQHLYLPGPHSGVWNHTCARASSYLLLTESLIDAATLWQAGYKNTTACYGTNGLTPDHIKLIQSNQVERLYLVMDGDDAGRRGAQRTADKLQSLDIEIFTVALPEGQDPNSYFLDGGNIEAFDALLKTATPLDGRKPVDSAPQSEITKKQGVAQVENTPQGFRVKFADRAYDVRTIDGSSTKLRATIKAMTNDRNHFHIDTVDLYAARSRKTFIADVAKLYHEETPIIEIDLNRIIQESEIRCQKSEDSEAQSDIIQLTDQDRRDAERFASRTDLLDLVAKDFTKCGYVGERQNVLMAYLTMTSRRMRNPLAMLILSGSGSGKSALQDTTLAFCPDEDLVKLTSITERALFYKDETSLKHKVLALEELAGAEDASYAIRNLISSGVLVIETTVKDQLTGRMTTMENKVYGPTAVFQTTTNPEIDPETRSRFIITSIDESSAQTKAILEAQRIARTLEGFQAKLERDQIVKRHHALQHILRPLAVINPYGKLLTYTHEQLLTRRDHPKYLDLIETVAFLHQYQKAVKRISVSGEQVEYIEVSLRDITLANELATEILGKSLDELNGPSRRLLLLTEKMVSQGAKEKGIEPHHIEFTRRQLREYSRWSDYQVRTHIGQLLELEYLVPCGGRQGSEYRYRLYWDGQGKAGERFMLGLKPVEQIRKEAEVLGIKD